jgi:hypothetical protein
MARQNHAGAVFSVAYLAGIELALTVGRIARHPGRHKMVLDQADPAIFRFFDIFKFAFGNVLELTFWNLPISVYSAGPVRYTSAPIRPPAPMTMSH